MAEGLQGHILLVAFALAFVIAIAVWLFLANRKTRIESDDTEDDAPARRNQALIDAPPAAMREQAPPPATAPPASAPPATPQAETTGAPAAPPPPASPASAPPSPPPVAAAAEDDLSRIKGIGPKLRAQLSGMGITTIAQIAAWDDADIDRIDAELGRFQGRIRRDDWVTQARLLQAGDIAAYENRFGKT